jgi:hypothetical protein
MAALRRSLERLDQQATPWQVAGTCAVAMATVLDAPAVVIHQHDARTGELRVIGIHAPNGGDLLGSTASIDDDFVATTVLVNEKPLMLRFEGAPPRFLGERHRRIGASRSLGAVPFMIADECMAILEVLDVAEARRPAIVAACKLVAEPLLRALERQASSAGRAHRPSSLELRARAPHARGPTFPKGTAILITAAS